MKKLCVVLILVSFPLFGYDIQTVNMGGGKTLNYIVTTDYRELEQFAFSEFGVQINIGQTSSWEDNTQNENLAPQLRSLMRQYTQQGKYNAFAMAVFTEDSGDVAQIIVNRCFFNNGVYVYQTAYWSF